MADRTTMVRACGLVPRSKKITQQQFHQHLAIIHRRLARGLHAMQHYVQFHGTDTNAAPFPRSIYDYVAETWFTDVDALRGVMSDPYFHNVIRKDEEYFVDHTRDTVFVTREHVKLPGPTLTEDRSFAKAMLLVRRRPETEVDEFRRWWDTELPAIAQSVVPGLSRYVQSLPADEAYTDTEPPFDGVAEFWRNDPASQDSPPLSLAEFGAAVSDSPIDIGSSESLLGHEFLIF